VEVKMGHLARDMKRIQLVLIELGCVLLRYSGQYEWWSYLRKNWKYRQHTALLMTADKIGPV